MYNTVQTLNSLSKFRILQWPSIRMYSEDYWFMIFEQQLVKIQIQSLSYASKLKFLIIYMTTIEYNYKTKNSNIKIFKYHKINI